ncbi:sulfatase [Halomicroarcula sp. GCM10025709]|uniref:sulfatase n=1 Tax=Haloarcula TaxID=2237 RepID=UPI0024C2BED2|nr:sulfatase [Halomicroarcula sp. YJ-61-S]
MSRKNIVWITLDSVRSDHTSMDGYERDTTPTMADIGRRGHQFTECIAHSKSTLPSSGAMLTGYTPSRNTLGIDGNVLPDGVRTIAERFSDAGYTTACLSRNSYVSPETGLDRGFDRFQWLAASNVYEAGVGTLLRYLLNIRSHSAGLTLDTAKHASPFLMNEVAKDWLDDFASQEPFFFYLHYNEPHRPYYPPKPYLDRYTDGLSMSPKAAAERALEIHYDFAEIIADGCNLTDEEWRALHAMYDAEIAYTDDMVRRLLSYIDSLPMDDPIVVVTADHGELFGEAGLLAHRYVLDDAVTRVPLVIDGIGDLAAGPDDLVQHADVMATLLAMADADHEDTMGVDLREEVREFAVSQRVSVGYDAILEHDPDFDTSQFHSGLLTALRTKEHKLLTSDDDPELFELPDEETDVADAQPETLASLSAALDDWLAVHGQPDTEAETGEFSDEVQDQLRDLGYI